MSEPTAKAAPITSSAAATPHFPEPPNRTSPPEMMNSHPEKVRSIVATLENFLPQPGQEDASEEMLDPQPPQVIIFFIPSSLTSPANMKG